MPRRRVVAVVGGGIAGLAAAYELSGGAAGPGPSTPSVVVFEGSERFGGKMRTGSIDGHPIDLAADGFLARRPEAAQLCREIGLGAALIPVGASGASVWSRGRARQLPPGLVLGVPTKWWATARSGILGPAGSARLALDWISPRPDRRGPIGDRSVGRLINRKLGHRVADRLVNPLIGGIHAGSITDMSSAAVFPLLLAVAQRRGSLMKALRRASALADRGAGDGPAFWALQGGMRTLTDRLEAVLTERGVELRRRSPVELIERGVAPGTSWLVHAGGQSLEADGVVLAVPAGPASRLLEPIEPNVAKVLSSLEYATAAVVTLTYPDGALPESLYGTGLLVPAGTRPLRRAAAGQRGPAEPPLITACTYLDRKWPHLAQPGSELLRASVGRFGDDRASQLTDGALVERVVAEVAALVGTTAAPTSSLVTRWQDCLPQYRVHHLLRVTAMEVALARQPPLAVAGAAYRGVGIPACILSGRTAAARVLEAMAELAAPAAPAGTAGTGVPAESGTSMGSHPGSHPQTNGATPANGTGPPR